MISKSEIKLIRSLSQKKYRDENGLFVAEGTKLVEEALTSDFEVEKVFYSTEIGEEAMSRITLLSSPSPALAVIKKPAAPSADEVNTIISRRPLAIALDSLRDPGNVGTIIRLADWFGIKAIFASHDTVDIYNPKVIQATMGAIFRVKFVYCDLGAILGEFSNHGMAVYGTYLDGEIIYSSELKSEGLIVMGSEANGISASLESLISKRLYIPPFTSDGAPTSESLNVAIATAIVCSEFRRNRR